MVDLLLYFGLLGLPFVAGLALIVASSRGSTDARSTRTRRTLIVTAAITALSAGVLNVIGGQVSLALTWVPGTGPMSLSLGASSLLAAAATAAALLAAVIATRPLAPLIGGAALLALAAGNVAFLADHFLLRYVALETVGLLVAAAPLLTHGLRLRDGPTKEAGASAAWVYLLLRLGDAGLLTAILVLWAHTGTLAITPALDAAAASGGSVQAWAAGGFLLAVAVKIGLWPFHAWIRTGEGLDRLAGTWLYATLMPNLGLYLLYRTAPLVSAAPGVRWAAVAVGAAAGGAALLTALRRRERGIGPARVMAAIGAVLWCAAVGVHYRIAWWGLLALSLARLPLFLRRAPAPEGSTWTALDASMRHFARRLQADVQEGLLERGLGTLAESLNGLAQWLHDHVEQDVLERGITESAEKTLTGAQRLHARVEEDGLEGGLRALVRATLHASHHLRLWHGGRLRVNLGWVVLSLIVATLVALVV